MAGTIPTVRSGTLTHAEINCLTGLARGNAQTLSGGITCNNQPQPKPRRLQKEEFDSITRLAQHVFEVDMCLVSIVDAERQWFMSKQGLEAKETPRSLAFCGHVVYNEEALVVLDATKDERFWKNDLVTGPPNIRFYAGCPLIVEGHVLGTICILHTAPLPDFPEDKLAVLRRFAHLVKMAIEQHKAQSIAEVKALGLRGLIEESTAPIFGLDKDGKCNELNAMAEQALEVRAGEVLGKDFSDELVAEDSKAYFRDTIQKLTDKPILEESLCFSFKSGKTGEPIDFVFSCAPRYDAMGRLAGHLLLGQNMEKLGGPQPQVPRIVLVKAAACAASLKTGGD